MTATGQSGESAHNILIVGLAGSNRGDDAIAECLSSAVQEMFPTSQVSLFAVRPPLNCHPKIHTHIIHRRSLRFHAQLWQAIARADAVIIGGGSIIQDKFGAGYIRSVMGLFFEVSFLTKLLGKKLITAPIGVDELETPRGRKIARAILARCDKVALRDTLSQNQLSKILANTPCEVYTDPAFCFPDVPFEPKPHLVASPALEGKDEEYIIAVNAAAITRYLEAYPDHTATLIAMDDRLQEDGGKISRIHARIPEALRERVTMRVPATASEAAAIIRSGSHLFAMRLHAIILGYGFVKSFCFSRTTKSDALMVESGVPGVRQADRLSPEVIAERMLASFRAEEYDTQALRAVKSARWQAYLDDIGTFIRANA